MILTQKSKRNTRESLSNASLLKSRKSVADTNQFHKHESEINEIKFERDQKPIKEESTKSARQRDNITLQKL